MTGYELLRDTKDGMIATGMWSPACPVPLERLCSVPISYIDFVGLQHDDGEIVVLDVVAQAVRSIFDRLLELRFPIAKVRSVHSYAGDDELSMADNNTSCFNYRPIEGTTITSIHSYGLAIDLNPEQNPYLVFAEELGTATIYPKQGWSFLNRVNRKPGMVEDIVDVFAQYGFGVWGGRWTTPIDFHHFQTPRGIAEILARTSYEDGLVIWQMTQKMPLKLDGVPNGGELASLFAAYESQNRELFFKHFERILQGPPA